MKKWLLFLLVLCLVGCSTPKQEELPLVEPGLVNII